MFDPEKVSQVPDFSKRLVFAGAAGMIGKLRLMSSLSSLNPEPSRISRNTFLKVGGSIGLSAAIFGLPALAVKKAESNEWIEVPKVPVQFREWFPLSENAVAEKGQPLIYDYIRGFDAWAGTDYAGKVESLVNWYFTAYPNLKKVYVDSTGFCNGGANAAAWGEQIESWDLEAWALYTLQHSGDSEVRLTPEGLVETIRQGQPCVIETNNWEGFWSRVAYGVSADGTRIKTTNFGLAPRVYWLSEVQKAYIPVQQGEEGYYPEGTVSPALDNVQSLEKWTFNLGRDNIEAYLTWRNAQRASFRLNRRMA